MFIKPVCKAFLIVLLIQSAGLAAESDLRLADAAKRKDHATVQSLLQQKVDVNSPALDGTTALHWAVRADDVSTIEMLIRAGANVKAADRYGITPLYLASVNGNAVIVGKLLDAGADANSVDPTGETTLMTASRTGDAATVRTLLDHGAAVNATDAEFQENALMLAVREGHPEAVRLLIERGATLDSRTRAGQLPPFRPPCKGTGCGSEGVGINRGGLPDRGIRPAATGGMTPLLYAARDGRLEEAKLLLAAGANIEKAEANEIRPLLMSVLNNHLDVARFLIEKGADLNANDFWGRSALWAAVDLRNMDLDHGVDTVLDRTPALELTKILLARGANPNIQTREVPPGRRWLYSLGDVSWVDFTGQTPFIRAALSADLTTMRLLMDHGADPNIVTPAGSTALMAAAGVNWVVQQTYTVSKEASLEAVKLCLEKGADLNAKNSMGLTPLLGAANRGSDDIIKYLVSKGAKLDVKDKEGRDAVTWAEGVFLAAVGAERKPSTVDLLKKLIAESTSGKSAKSQ